MRMANTRVQRCMNKSGHWMQVRLFAGMEKLLLNVRAVQFSEH